MIAALLVSLVLQAPTQFRPPEMVEDDFVRKNFRFNSGETLPELRIHARTRGKPKMNERGFVTNAVLIMHGTGGTGGQFTGRGFAGELFLPGQPLDVTKYFIVLPDDIGHGNSSKPSDGLRAKFPRYGYQDMITAEYRLLSEGLAVNHLRLVMGTSMGGMHTWLWGERWPEFMDALMPLASVPGQISGRNRVWRRVVIDAIRNDPEWQGGNYTKQPPSPRTAAEMLWLVSSNPVIRQRATPTLDSTDVVIDDYVVNWVRYNDVNDQLYALESSLDYDPGPDLEKIAAPLFAVNSPDDLVNPPEIGLLEKEITRVPKGRAIMIPLSDRTAGHGTHTLAAVSKP